MIQDAINDAVRNIQQQQEELIKRRVLRLTGLELDIIEESKRRFPRLVGFQKGNEMSYYWNDGSVDGICIITFVQEPMDLSKLDDLKLSISVSYK